MSPSPSVGWNIVSQNAGTEWWRKSSKLQKTGWARARVSEEKKTESHSVQCAQSYSKQMSNLSIRWMENIFFSVLYLIWSDECGDRNEDEMKKSPLFVSDLHLIDSHYYSKTKDRNPQLFFRGVRNVNTEYHYPHSMTRKERGKEKISTTSKDSGFNY